MKKVLISSILLMVFILFGCDSKNQEPKQYCAVTITANSSNDFNVIHVSVLDENSKIETTSNYLGTYNAPDKGVVNIDFEYICYRCSGFSAKWIPASVSIPINSVSAMTVELKYGTKRPNTSSHSYVDVYINGALFDSFQK